MQKSLTDRFHSRVFRILLTALFLSPAFLSFGQSLSAEDEARLGIRLIDDKEYAQGIKHLRTARNLNLGEFEYPFEIGRAFLLWGKAKKAVPIGLDRTIYDVLAPCAMTGEDATTLVALSTKLACVIDAWNKASEAPRVPVIDHLAIVKSKDRLLDYIFWLYGESDRTEMNTWGAENSAQFNEFATWIFWNGIELDASKPFNRLKH